MLSPAPGALVISLDFELAWGVFDTLPPDGGYRKNLLGAREAIPRILDVFEQYDVAATWATVGFLFAESRDELEHFAPEVRPTYLNKKLDPYSVPLGRNERESPLQYAPSLIAEVASRRRQEVASHTFSHYYCLEEGQTLDQFEADTASAVEIARSRGIALRSMVFPRNQIRDDYLMSLPKNGFTSFRGAEDHLLYRPRPGRSGNLLIRSARLADAFVNISGNGGVPQTLLRSGDNKLANIRSSRFLRPAVARMGPLEDLRLRRVINSMKASALTGSFFHLWWHPHNFGADIGGNLRGLSILLREYQSLRDAYGFRSLTMHEAAASAHPEG